MPIPITRAEYEKKFGVKPSQPVQAEPQGSFGGAIGGFAKGAVKKTASTLQNVGKLVTNPLAKVAGVDPKSLGIPEEKLKLEGTAQKVGGFASDIASFAVPGGGATKITKGASTLAKMGTQGIVGGATAAAQQGQFDKGARDVAILSAIFPGAGKIAQGMKVKIGEKSAPKIINSLIKPLKKDLAYGKNPGRAVAKEKIIASSLDDLEVKIGEKLTKRLSEYEQKLAQTKVPFNIETSLKPLDDIIDKAVKQNNQAVVNRLQEIRQALTTNLVKQTDAAGKLIIQPGLPKNLRGLNASEIRQFKQDVGELTKFTGNMSDDQLINKALKQVYGKADEILNKAVPGSKALSSRIADLISAKTATKYRNELMERQNLIEFTPKVLGGAGVAMTIFSGGNPVPAIIGLGAAGLEKAMSTPAFKTRFASWLASASTEQRNQLIQKAPWAKGILQNLLLGVREQDMPN